MRAPRRRDADGVESKEGGEKMVGWVEGDPEWNTYLLTLL